MTDIDTIYAARTLNEKEKQYEWRPPKKGEAFVRTREPRRQEWGFEIAERDYAKPRLILPATDQKWAGGAA